MSENGIASLSTMCLRMMVFSGFNEERLPSALKEEFGVMQSLLIPCPHQTLQRVIALHKDKMPRDILKLEAFLPQAFISYYAPQRNPKSMLLHRLAVTSLIGDKDQCFSACFLCKKEGADPISIVSQICCGENIDVLAGLFGVGKKSVPEGQRFVPTMGILNVLVEQGFLEGVRMLCGMGDWALPEGQRLTPNKDTLKCAIRHERPPGYRSGNPDIVRFLCGIGNGTLPEGRRVEPSKEVLDAAIFEHDLETVQFFFLNGSDREYIVERLCGLSDRDVEILSSLLGLGKNGLPQGKRLNSEMNILKLSIRYGHLPLTRFLCGVGEGALPEGQRLTLDERALEPHPIFGPDLTVGNVATLRFLCGVGSDSLPEGRRVIPTLDALNAAASKGDLEAVHFFLAIGKGSLPEELRIRPTAETLGCAAYGGHMDIVRCLCGIGEGALPEKRRIIPPPQNVLARTAFLGKIEVVRFFCGIGKDSLPLPLRINPNRGALVSAILGGHIDIIRFFYGIGEGALPVDRRFEPEPEDLSPAVATYHECRDLRDKIVQIVWIICGIGEMALPEDRKLKTIPERILWYAEGPVREILKGMLIQSEQPR